ncbi:MAG: hypothetical protein ABW110_00320 [Steroidobacteraceae bacterium]
MSLAPLATLMVIVGAESSGEPLEQLTARWDSECTAAETAAECVGLAADIELGLYDLLRKLSLSRQPIDREVLRAAAQSRLPALAKLGVGLLGAPQSPDDVSTLVRAVDHPVLAVRFVAARNLEQAQHPTWKALQPWWTGWTLASSANGPEESLIPDPKPLPSVFGMTSFNGLTFHYYGSDRERALFTTPEAAETLVARFGKSRKVMSSMDAMSEQMDAIQPEMDAITKEMEAASAAGDMNRITKAMQRMQDMQSKMGNLQTVTANPMAESHTVILEQDASKKRSTATVLIQRDEQLKQTVLVFWREGGWRW